MRLSALLIGTALITTTAACGTEAAPDGGPSLNPDNPWDPDQRGPSYPACVADSQASGQQRWRGRATFDASGDSVHEEFGWYGAAIQYQVDYRFIDHRVQDIRWSLPDGTPFLTRTFVRSPNGAVIRTDYDGAYDLSARADGTTDRATFWRYDAHDLTIGFDYDDDGDGAIDANHVLDAFYDADGQLVLVDEHDPDGGRVERFDRDELGRLTHSTVDLGHDDTIDQELYFTYDEHGRLWTQRNNGRLETYEYAGSDRPVHLDSPIEQRWWSYDCTPATAAGNAAIELVVADPLPARPR